MKKLGQLIEGVVPRDDSTDWGIPIVEIVSDSRQVVPGTLFIAIQGFQSDGHDYIAQAVKRGAVAVVCEKPVKIAGTAVIRVPDTRKIQAQIAARFFDTPAEKMSMHGVTGTNGKTTSAYLMESVLRHCGFEPGLIGTVTYRWKGRETAASRTTPDAIDIQRLLSQMCSEGIDAVAMEVSSHSLDLDRVNGIPFKSAIFTNLTRDHLDYHKSFEAYAEVKSRLFSMIEHGVGVVNGDDPASDTMMRMANGPVVRFGISSDQFEYQIVDICESENGTTFTLKMRSNRFEFHTPLWGQFNVYNAAGVATAALALGYDPERIAEGIRVIRRIPGRMEGLTSKSGFRVVIDYAHTPDALKNVLKTARAFTPGRLIVVFGCGGDRDRGKRPEMGQIASEIADRVIVTSDNPRTEDPDVIIQEILAGIPALQEKTVIADRREAIHTALDSAQSGDTVILAGKGHESYQEIGKERYPFDDRIVAEEYLKQLEGR